MVNYPRRNCFSTCRRWAMAECKRRRIPPKDPKNQRKVLGEAFDLIPFARMTLKEFHGIAVNVSIVLWFGCSCRILLSLLQLWFGNTDNTCLYYRARCWHGKKSPGWPSTWRTSMMRHCPLANYSNRYFHMTCSITYRNLSEPLLIEIVRAVSE